MSKKDMLEHISKLHRQAIHKFMDARGLAVQPWCKKAGIAESTLRTFLNGPNNSIQSNNLYLLAQAEHTTIGQLLGEQPFTIDESLMVTACETVDKAARLEKIKLSPRQLIEATLQLYNEIQQDNRNGQESKPSEALARTILKYKKM